MNKLWERVVNSQNTRLVLPPSLGYVASLLKSLFTHLLNVLIERFKLAYVLYAIIPTPVPRQTLLTHQSPVSHCTKPTFDTVLSEVTRDTTQDSTR